jgi:hypothetical protein
MPYVEGWEDNPHDESLPVLKELPDGFVARETLFKSQLQETNSRIIDGKYVMYHYCKHCEGWIIGHPYTYDVNNIRPRSGRRGHCYSCARCGEEIAFNGIMS